MSSNPPLMCGVFLVACAITTSLQSASARATPSNMFALDQCPIVCPTGWNEQAAQGNCCFTLTTGHRNETAGSSDTPCSPQNTCEKCTASTTVVLTSGCGLFGQLTWNESTPTADTSGSGTTSTIWYHESLCDYFGGYYYFSATWTPTVGSPCTDGFFTSLLCGCS